MSSAEIDWTLSHTETDCQAFLFLMGDVREQCLILSNSFFYIQLCIGESVEGLVTVLKCGLDSVELCRRQYFEEPVQPNVKV